MYALSKIKIGRNTKKTSSHVSSSQLIYESIGKKSFKKKTATHIKKTNMVYGIFTLFAARKLNEETKSKRIIETICIKKSQSI